MRRRETDQSDETCLLNYYNIHQLSQKDLETFLCLDFKADMIFGDKVSFINI